MGPLLGLALGPPRGCPSSDVRLAASSPALRRPSTPASAPQHHAASCPPPCLPARLPSLLRGGAQGHYIIEYAGEVIDERELGRRMDHARMNGEQHFYIMELSAGACVGAWRVGGCVGGRGG